MKPNIRILPEHLCNQIAAGEVVERPASVVKELVENSLDAGAKEIRIEVEKGGKRLIRVMDDGSGMGRDDIFLCLERHATSKIQSESDLFRLHSLGFRGEALPSIAAVSRLTLRSRPGEAEEGWEIYVEGGTVRKAGAIGTPCGTSVEVRDLFFNTPARRKFLRRDETELGHIGDIVTKLALGRPEVQFRLVHNGRPLIEAYRQASLSERIGALLGRPLLRELVPVSKTGESGIRLNGFISQPGTNRSTPGGVYAFINGRYIRDRVVQHALMEGYRNLLTKGRYPVAVLFLDIDPETVDVNVHPTKHEVRFREQAPVHDFIAEAVREALRPSAWLAVAPPEPGTEADLRPVPPRPLPGVGSGRSGGGGIPLADPVDGKLRGVQEALLAYARSPQGGGTEAAAQETPFVLPAKTDPREKGFFSSLAVIGQFRRTYILGQDGDDLILIDQHAAHERIGFERLKVQYGKGEVERQALLFPAVLELDFREAALLEEHLVELGRLGFDLEPFGPRAFALKAVPRVLGDRQAEHLVREVAGELAAVGKSGLVEEALDNILILMACHGMIRANQDLAGPEIGALLSDLDRVDFKAQCPHGRPVMIRLTLAEVEKMFKRS